MEETRTNDYDKAMPANAVIKCIICGEPILLEPREGYQVAVCKKCKKAVMRIREQSTTDVMPNKATPYVSLTTDPIIPYKETAQQKTKCFMCSNLNEHKLIQVTLWERISPDEVKENDYKAKYCPNCGRRIEYVEELCKTYQP